ncbi:hypothetical protein Enr8_44820 [Blastopirellula retiformator]|uniref:Transposase IS4-like domain-containing protein n=1 Tax=Blastopirellula retiformator TaxID=2527970 RepID=A0A5C5UW96_9BACT|nr:hypothetical protein Enr8_44820 [Blastopirellula retiformator]
MLLRRHRESFLEELRRFDQRRKDKKVSNEEWVSKSAPDAKIGKMKDGRTHLKYKAENAVDLDTEVILAAEIYHGDQGDTTTIEDTIIAAQTDLEQKRCQNSLFRPGATFFGLPRGRRVESRFRRRAIDWVQSGSPKGEPRRIAWRTASTSFLDIA